MALLDEIVAFLAAEGLGTVSTDIFPAMMPAGPDACCAVYETGGVSPDPGFGSSTLRFENPAIQVVFRGAANDYTGPRANMQTAFDSLVGISAGQVLSSTIYYLVTALQQPFPLGGQDENRRWKIACNFLIQKDPS